MGSGASKTALLRHSESRVEEIRGYVAASTGRPRALSVPRSAASDDRHSTFSLRLTNSPEKPEQVSSPREASEGDKRSRSKSYPDLDHLELWQSTKILAALHEAGDSNGDTSHSSSHSPPTSNPPSPHGSVGGLVHAASIRVEPPEGLTSSSDIINSNHDDYDYELDPFEQEITDWRKGETIGSGSYGTVYLARDEETGILMAVKEILVEDESDIDVNAATKEVELLRYLRHDHVVKYLGSFVDADNKKLSIFTVSTKHNCEFTRTVGTHHDHLYAAQEWVPGGNLEQNRKRFGGNEKIVRRFTMQILRGVAYLHSKNIVHHDIKVCAWLVADKEDIACSLTFVRSRQTFLSIRTAL